MLLNSPQHNPQPSTHNPMKTLPHIPINGLVARLAIQCTCPDTGATGSFLFAGESPKSRHSRVTPIYPDLAELFPAVKASGWQEVKDGNAGFIYNQSNSVP